MNDKQKLSVINITQELSGVTHKSPSQVATELSGVGVTCFIMIDKNWYDLRYLNDKLDVVAENVQVKTKGGGMVMLGSGHTAFDVADSCRDLANV